MGQGARKAVAGVAAVALTVLLAFAVFSGALFTHGAAAILEYTPPPINDVPPSVSGSLVVGSTLTGDPGVWEGATRFAYSWRRCVPGCTVISGARKTAYRLQQADLGHRLLFEVTASNTAGSTTAVVMTDVVVEGPVVKTLPKVTGQLAVGQQLSTTDGTWVGTQPITFTYGWDRCDPNGKSCAAIGGANAAATCSSQPITATGSARRSPRRTPLPRRPPSPRRPGS